MGLSINYDPGTFALASYAARSSFSLYRTMEKLASGYSINSAADGPAQLVISENLRTQIGSLSQEIRNTSFNISKYNTGSSTLLEMRSQLTELRTLAIGAADEGGNNETTQAAYAATADYLVSNYHLTIDTAQFNDQNLLDGSDGSIADLDYLIAVDLSSAEASELSLEKIDAAIGQVDSAIVEAGAFQKNSLESQLASMQVTRQNLIAAESQIRDTDYLAEFTNMVRQSFQLKASLSLMAHAQQNAATILGIFRT